MARSSRSSRPEAGVTLVELIVTIALLGIAFTAILAALSSMYANGDVERKTALSETVLRRYAESVQSATYVSCATTSSYDSALTLSPAAPTGYTASITSVAYWDGNVPPAFGSSCTADTGVQRITLQVTETTRNMSRSVVLEKRDPA